MEGRIGHLSLPSLPSLCLDLTLFYEVVSRMRQTSAHEVASERLSEVLAIRRNQAQPFALCHRRSYDFLTSERV